MNLIKYFKNLFSKSKDEPPQSALPKDDPSEAFDCPCVTFQLRNDTIYVKVRWTDDNTLNSNFLENFGIMLFGITSGTLNAQILKGIETWATSRGNAQLGATLAKHLEARLVAQNQKIIQDVRDADREVGEELVMLPSEVFGSYRRKRRKNNSEQ